MKVGTRVVFTIFVLIILVICALIIVGGLGLISTSSIQALFNGFLNSNYKYVWVGIAAVLFVVGVCLLFFRVGTKDPDTVELVSTVDGDVSISIGAIEELAARYLAGVSGIIVQKIRVNPVSAGVIKLTFYICVKAGVEMPAITEQVRADSMEYIQKYSGLNVNSVSIKIMPVKNAK